MEPSALHVLLVDDSPEDRLTVRRLLTRSAPGIYTITEVDRGERALAVCRTRPPDCVLLDHHLPDMDGLELFAALRAQSDAPVVVLTGVGSLTTGGAGPSCGNPAFLAKRTLTAEQLRLTIVHAVAEARRTRAHARDLALLTTLVDILAVGLGLLDQDLRILQVNAALATLLGQPATALGGQRFADCWPDLAQALAPQCTQILAIGRPSYQGAIVAASPYPGAAPELWQTGLQRLALPDTGAPALCLVIHAVWPLVQQGAIRPDQER
ncbi:MAG: response regulator [Chloroflexales bacterium]|nr:response regulator [Chloroflexales bacterium]